MGATERIPNTIPLYVTTGVEPEPTPGLVPTPVMGPYMVTISSGGGSESDELGEDLLWGLRGL